MLLEVMQMKYHHLFSPIRLGDVELKNRIIFLAHWTNYGHNHGYREDGLASEKLAMHYIERAKGGAGLVCVTQSVSPTGQMGRSMVNAHDPRNEETFRFMCEEIHQYGCKVFGQFNHRGHTSCMQRPPMLYAPTQMTAPHCYVNTKELEIDEMEEIKEYYVKAAVMEKQWGFDGVEIKIAHDGLLRTFISPYLNRREDRYGGSFENRMRYPLEIIRAVRDAVGPGYPIGIRLCMDEFTEWGYSWEYGVKVALELEKAGVTYINSDAGSFSNYNFEIPNNYIPMGFGVYMAAALKKALRIPVVAFGRINDPAQAEDILAEGHADMIGMCRQLICDPETPEKALEGREDQIRHCVACSEGCGLVTQQEGVVCVHNPAAGREKLLGIGTLKRVEKPKTVMVIGAGIAGMKTAEILAERGHHVTVYEKSGEAGGQMLLAERIPMRAEMSEVYRYLRVRLQHLGVPVYLNTEVDETLVERENPEVVIAATGSHPLIPEYIPEGQGMTVLDPRSVMMHPERVGRKVVLLDDIGYWQGLGTADYISALGAQVEIVTKEFYAGIDIEETCRENLYMRLGKKEAVFHASSVIAGIRENTVILRNVFSKQEELITGVDTFVAASESRSDNRLYKKLKQKGGREIYCIGDAAAPGTVLRIIFDAEELGRSI